MGWLSLLLIGFAAFVMLWRAAASRGLAMIIAAALLFGAAGYAWQQNAWLPAYPVQANAQAIEIDPGLITFRSAIMPGRPEDAAIFAAADASLRKGDTTGAAQWFVEAIARRPNDAALWAGLGGAVAAHDGGQVSPTAHFAFKRAIALAPNEPGPPFFLGLAYIQAGEFAPAKAAWLRALRLAPRNAPYRIDIAEKLVMIDQFEKMQASGVLKPQAARP